MTAGKLDAVPLGQPPGMLGPIAEAHIDELDLLKLSNQSLARYPEWVDELETETEDANRLPSRRHAHYRN